MKYTWKKLTVLSLIVCMLAISTAGCGSAPAAEAGTKLDAPEPLSNEADASNEENTDDAKPVDTEKNNADLSDDTKTPAQDNPDDSADAEKENPSETSGKWHVYDADLAAATDADFEGVVYRIDTDSFFITPTEARLEADGSLSASSIAPGVEIPDEELVQVVFDDKTVFTLRDIYDGGARYEDSDASFQNVEKGLSISLKGGFQNNTFHASAIRIIKVH